MAAIDFPASPANAQIFSAPNGVTYRYQSSPGMWLAVGQSAGGGDFAASGSPPLNATGLVMVLPVVNGNSGGYYNASTGRWTPPAGRYNLYGAIGAYYNAGGTGINVYIRKNGVNVVSANINTAGANSWSLCPVETQVDANGTDYFDLWAQATATGSEGYFGAFPISGIQGPPGLPPSALVLYSESVLASPAADIRVTIPANAKKIELVFGTSNSGSVDASLFLQMMQGATPVTSAIYAGELLYGNHGTVTGAYQTAIASGWIGANGTLWSGTIRPIPWASPVGDTMSGECWMYGHNAVASAHYNLGFSLVCTGGAVALSSITGFRLVNGTAVNFAAGSFMRCFVVV